MSFGDTDDVVLLTTTFESLLDDRFDSSRRRLVSFSWQIFHSSSMLKFSITRKAPFRVTNASCITSIGQNWQPTLLALPCPRLIRAFSPPPHVPFLERRITNPHSVPAGGVDTPRLAALWCRHYLPQPTQVNQQQSAHCAAQALAANAAA